MDLDKIYKEYFDIVFKYLLFLSHDYDLSEELTQETFYKAIRNINKFKGNCKISTWLIQIAKNLYFDEFKKQNKKTNIEEIYLKSYEENIEDLIISKDEKERLKAQIEKMDHLHKQLMVYRISGELSFKDIGILLNKSENWARVTFYREKRKLMKGEWDNGKKL